MTGTCARRFALAVLVGAVCACNPQGESAGDGDEAEPPEEAAGAAGPGTGIDTVEDASAMMAEASAIADATWPGAQLGGIQIAPELSMTVGDNVYTLRMAYEFASDPEDQTARSGSVVCNPECRVIRHQVRRSPAPPMPCALGDALVAARGAGITGERPVVTYGWWSFDGQAGWVFRESREGEAIEVGAGCVVR